MKKIRTSVKKQRAQQKNKVSDFSVTCIKQTARNTQISKPKVKIYNRRFLRRYQSVFCEKQTPVLCEKPRRTGVFNCLWGTKKMDLRF